MTDFSIQYIQNENDPFGGFKQVADSELELFSPKTILYPVSPILLVGMYRKLKYLVCFSKSNKW